MSDQVCCFVQVPLCIVECTQGGVFLGRLMQRGPAVGLNDRYASTPRWPRNGILKEFAVRDLSSLLSTLTATGHMLHIFDHNVCQDFAALDLL